MKEKKKKKRRRRVKKPLPILTTRFHTTTNFHEKSSLESLFDPPSLLKEL